MKLLDRLFRHEEINGGNRCPTYMHRWTLLRLWRGMGVYLHKIIADDWARDLHDHPKRFVSIGLWGSYIEITPASTNEGLFPFWSTVATPFQAPWVRTFPPEHRHRLMLPEGQRPCWTLVLVGPVRREWGFWHHGVWWHWRDYLKSIHADEERSC